MSSRALTCADGRAELELRAGSCGVSVGKREGPLAPEPNRRAVAPLDAHRSRTASLVRQCSRPVLLALIRRDGTGAEQLIDGASKPSGEMAHRWRGFREGLNGTAAGLRKEG